MKYLFVFLFAALCVVALFLFPHTMLNPGDLIEGHQKIKNECMSCHKPFGGIDNNKCISCHKLADIGKTKATAQASSIVKILFHQNLANQKCSSCHGDHKGLQANTATTDFKHELLSTAIINQCLNCHQKPRDALHAQLEPNCGSCHQTNNWKENVAFSHDMIVRVNKNECTLCHKSPGDSFHLLTKDNCNKCHGTSKWNPSTFDHSIYFVLDGHHNTACKTCHQQTEYSSYTCYGCHEHSENSIRAEHSEEGISNYQNCVSCHKSGNEHEGTRKNSKENTRNKREGEQEEDED